MSGQIVLPGFVNCHHHLNQTLTRNLPCSQNNNLFPWLRGQYRIWAGTSLAAASKHAVGNAREALFTVYQHGMVWLIGSVAAAATAAFFFKPPPPEKPGA